MRLYADTLWAQKAGMSEAEYEDAFWPTDTVEGIAERRFAVADGATETSFSKIWAKQLVRAYGRGEMDNPEDLNGTLHKLQERWWGIVKRKSLAWYAEQKIESGTYAALLGLTLLNDEAGGHNGTWFSTACGDCCLVHLRGDSVLKLFPVEKYSDFNSHPFLVSSHPSALAESVSSLKTVEGTWNCEDRFLLMSDALAAWFYRSLEEGGKPWIVLRDLGYEQPFRPWLDDLRRIGDIRNDDVTLSRISIE